MKDEPEQELPEREPPPRSNAAADQFDDVPRSEDHLDWPSDFHGNGWRRMGGGL